MADKKITQAIADSVGRRNIAQVCEVGATAVSNAVVRGRFPSSWYFPLKYLCEQKEQECPIEIFGLKSAPNPQLVDGVGKVNEPVDD